MKIWIVVLDYNDGYGQPEGAFTTEELANAFIKAQGFRLPRVVELELDKPPEVP